MNAQSCGQCPTEFSCASLNTALAILEKDKGLANDPARLAQYRKVLDTLAKAGWNYPNGGGCHLVGMTPEVRQMVRELIDVLERQSPRKHLCNVESYLAEEYHRE